MIRAQLDRNALTSRLIIPTVQDADSSAEASSKAGEMTYSNYTYPTRLGAAGVFLFLLLVPLVVYAGFFSSDDADTYSAVRPLENNQRISLLKPARNQDPTRSVGGGGIALVDDSALLSAAGPTDTAAKQEETGRSGNEISLYVVREGDTLSQIGEMFDVSVNTIVWANDQVDSTKDITPGDTLVILPISGVQHTVEEGETLSEIVKEYDGNLKEVRNFNNIGEDESLAVGDAITIPNGEMTRSHSGDNAESTAQSRTVARSQPSYSGYYRRPVNGGARTQGHHGYNAVDIGAARGTPILAAADGTVIVEKGYGYNGGYGRYVVVRHDNGTQTLYAHNSENIVSVGQQVVQGQVIGYMGSTGRSTGPHVHFEVRGARNPF